MELDGGIKIYLREIGKTDLLTPAAGGRTCRPHQEGRPGGAQPHDPRQPAPRGEDRPGLRQLRPASARPDLRRQHRPDEGRGTLRPQQGRQALHLRRLVDQAVHQARAGQPVQDDPPARPPGGQDLQDAPRGHGDVARNSAASRPTTNCPRKSASTAPSSASSRPRPCAPRPSTRRSATTTAPSSAKSSATRTRRRPSTCCSHKNMHSQLDGLLTVLDERERKIIDARFGLNGQKAAHARGSRPGVRRHPRAHPPAAEHRAAQAAPRPAEEGRPDSEGAPRQRWQTRPQEKGKGRGGGVIAAPSGTRPRVLFPTP